MGEVFRKAVRLCPDGRKVYGGGDLINLLSVDACRIVRHFPYPCFTLV